MPDPRTSETAPGEGPLEQIFLRWRRGQIGADVALREAAAPAMVQQYDERRLIRLSEAVVRLGYQGRWEDARDVHRLLRTCAAAGGDRLAAAAMRLATDFLRVATTALWQRPDAALYREARAAGVAAHAEATGAARGEFAHLLGILHLDPYVADRPDAAARTLWWQKAVDNASSGPTPDGLPDVLDALQESRVWLRRALDDVQGIQRLETLKALLQCLYGAEMSGEQVDPAVARPLLDEALTLVGLAPHRTDIRAFLKSVADRLHVTAEADDIAALVEHDWAHDIDTIGIDLVLAQLVPVFASRRDPAATLRLAESTAWIFERHGAESSRIHFYQHVVGMLAGHRIESPSAGAIEAMFADLAGTPADQRGPLFEQVFAWVFGLVREDREGDAFEMLRQLGRAAPELWQTWGNPINHLGGQLQSGAAVNALRAGDHDGCVREYYAAWTTFSALALWSEGLDTLRRLAEVLPQASVKSAQVACELLREEPAVVAEDALDAWQNACAQIAAAAMRGFARGASADAWFAAMRLAKGPAFANLVANTEFYVWQEDPRAAALRSEIDRLGAAAAPADLMEQNTVFELALVSHRGSPLDTAGETVAEQRDNLARRLDLHVQRQMAKASRVHSSRFTAEDVCARLEADAVLLDFYQPATGVDAPACCLVMTRETQRAFGLVTPPLLRAVRVQGSTGTYETTEAGVAVSQLRESLQLDPVPGHPVAAEAVRALDQCTQRFLGPALDYLDALYAQGKRQLLVVPSGPLHFFPLHLLGRAQATLADRWTVLYLPSMDLLRGAPASQAGSPRAFVFGLGYADDPHGLDPLKGALDEARAVAAALGVKPVLDGDATRAAVLDALEHGRWIHVGCHGRYDVVAPSLQALQLAPSADDDGRLASVDLHALDLSGVELLSLGACETALGRFDTGDNLRGLTASALAAGVGSVVGTLWPARDEAARIFFTTLFTGVAAGASRSEAFRQAQVQTREAYPEHRDWAPFYLSR